MSILFSILLFAAASAYIARTEKQIRISALVFALVGGGAILLTAIASLFGYSILAVSGWLKADLYSWFMVALVAFTYITATIVSVRYTGEETREKLMTIDMVRIYFFSIPLFILSMILAVFADHLAVLWIGLEGTTLTTTLLVALYRKDASIEAAWKFIMLCSIGIGLGMIGMLMFVHAGIESGLDVFESFSLSTLREHANILSVSTAKLAFVFILVGLGTKVGFVPMHTWLPDAHSKTPSPISALLSGVLLNVAFYAVLRFKTTTDLVIGNASWTNNLMIGFGLLSVVTAALFLLQQRNYKRMLAYSSVEHMGLMGFASGLGPVGVLALTIHAVFHTFTKSALFFLSGEILLSQKTTKIAGIKNLMKVLPITSCLFLLGILAIIAVPPSGLFTSEFMIVGAGLQFYKWPTIVLLVSLSVIAFSMLKSTTSMLYTKEEDSKMSEVIIHKERWTLTHGVAIVQLCLIFLFGLLIMTTPVMEFFTAISKSI
jgi:hydrogenase-4 component F